MGSSNLKTCNSRWSLGCLAENRGGLIFEGNECNSAGSNDRTNQSIVWICLCYDDRTKLGIFNWSADWAEATPLYEQAGLSVSLFVAGSFVFWQRDLPSFVWCYYHIKCTPVTPSLSLSLHWTASAFKLAKMPEAAKMCYEKAGTGQERISSYPPQCSRINMFPVVNKGPLMIYVWLVQHIVLAACWLVGPSK